MTCFHTSPLYYLRALHRLQWDQNEKFCDLLHTVVLLTVVVHSSHPIYRFLPIN